MDYVNIDLTQSAKKGYADIATYSEKLGNLSNNMKAQQKLKLLNHQVILKGLSKLYGIDTNFDTKVSLLLKNIENLLEEKKTPFIKIFSIHIIVFLTLFIITIILNIDTFSVAYAFVSVGMGFATGTLNLMLLRERKKYEINNLFFLLEEENIEIFEPLHKKLAITIDNLKQEKNINDEKITNELKIIMLNSLKE